MLMNEWNRINNVAMEGLKMRSMLLEAIDIYAAEHGYSSVELQMAFELLRSTLTTLERVLTEPRRDIIK